MRRPLVVAALGAAAAAALAAVRRRSATGDPRTDGGARARTERMRREIQQARERLGEELARTRET